MYQQEGDFFQVCQPVGFLAAVITFGDLDDF
jgi:hypothetical protein